MFRFEVRGAEELRSRILYAKSALAGETIPNAVERTVRRAASLAKRSIGRENNWWAPLAVTTVKEKRRLGYTGRLSATDPLLRTGAMRASIHAVARGLVGAVESDSNVLHWQDQGTRTIPARHVLLPALLAATERSSQRLRSAWREAWGV